MPEVFAPLPVRDELAIKEPGSERLLMSKPFIDWFAKMTLRVDQTPQQVHAVSLTDQEAAIPTTSVGITTQGQSLFRISYYLRITRKAGGSSKVQLTINWFDGGENCTAQSVELTANTPNAAIGDSVVVHVDQPPIVNFSTTYTSTGNPTMQYRVDVIAEAIG